MIIFRQSLLLESNILIWLVQISKLLQGFSVPTSTVLAINHQLSVIVWILGVQTPVLTIVQHTFYSPSHLPKNSKYILNNNLHFLFLLYFILVSNIYWIWDISLRVTCFPCYTPFKKPKFSYLSDYNLEIVSGLELGAFFISDLGLHLMYSYRNGA